LRLGHALFRVRRIEDSIFSPPNFFDYCGKCRDRARLCLFKLLTKHPSFKFQPPTSDARLLCGRQVLYNPHRDNGSHPAHGPDPTPQGTLPRCFPCYSTNYTPIYLVAIFVGGTGASSMAQVFVHEPRRNAFLPPNHPLLPPILHGDKMDIDNVKGNARCLCHVRVLS